MRFASMGREKERQARRHGDEVDGNGRRHGEPLSLGTAIVIS
jgi:hypothetical protein